MPGMRPRLLAPIAALLLGLLPASLRGADEPWLEKPFSADPSAALKAAEKPLPGETEENTEGIRVLLDEARYSLDAEGRATVSRRRVVKVLTADAVEGADTVQATWKPWLEAAPLLRARVIRPNGAVLVLDPKTIDESPASPDPGLFDDRKLLRAPIPGVEAGAIVEWETTKTRTTPPFAGTLGGQPLAYLYPVGRIRCRVEASASLPFAWKSLGLDLQPRTALASGRIVRTWERTAVPPLDDIEDGTPPDVAQQPQVEFSTGTSWQKAADFYRARVDERIAAGAPPAGFLPRGPFESRLHEMASLAEVVRRDVRYTGVHFGEAALVPTAPDEVVRRRFGDCKDQATLLTALLRARGFDAAVALVNADGYPDVEPALPSLEGFDHAIVHVAGFGASGVFIDTTSRFERVGEVPAPLEGRLALICRPGTTGLVRIPASPAAANTSRTTVTVTIPEFGRTRCREEVAYTGAFETNRRSFYDGVSEADRKKYFERQADVRYLGATLVRGTVTDARDLSKPFRVELEMERSRLAEATDQGATFLVEPSVVLGNLPDPGEKKRRLDLEATAFLQVQTYRLVPPPGFVPLELPKGRVREMGPARFESEAARDPDGSVRVTLSVRLDSARLNPADAEALRAGLEELRGLEPVAISFAHEAEVAVTHGKVAEGLALLRAEIARDPSRAAPHRRLSRLYLAVGLGEAARREAREAVRVEPGSGRAWFQLGFVLEHDLAGRLRRKGWEPAEAEKALRKAAELDPDDLESRFETAILLEFDAEGYRYADAARLERALAEYRKLVEKEPENTTLARNEVVALLRAGHATEALAVLEKRSDVAQLPGLKVWALACLRGAERALEQLRREVPDDATRRSRAAEIGSLLLSGRRYGEAAAFIREASRGGDAAAATAAQADYVAGFRRLDGPVPPPADDPVAVVRAYLATTFDPTVPPESVAALFVRAVGEARDAAGRRPVVEAIRETRRTISTTARLTTLPIAVVRDGGFSSGKLTAEGSPEDGWLASGTFLGAGSGPVRLRVWLAREGGHVRIVSDGPVVRDLSLYALDLLDRGDVAGARRWLDRAARELERGDEERDLLLDPLLPALRAGEGSPARDLRIEALAGLAGTPLADSRVDELRAFRKEKPDDPVRAALLFRALSARAAAVPPPSAARAEALRQEAVPLLEVVAADKPSSEAARLTSISLLQRLGRRKEALERAEEHATSHGGCRVVGSLLVSLRLDAGDEAGALDLSERLMARPSPSPGDANEAAWLRYALGRTDEKALEYGRLAAGGTREPRPGYLNTLAAIFAELGRNEEAHSLVLRSMEVDGLDEPEEADWLVVGRIRENYGLLDDARKAYGRLLKEGEANDEPSRLSVTTLARRRLAALGGERKQ